MLLRSAHLLAMCWLAVALHAPATGAAGADAARVSAAAAALLASGLALLAIELADGRMSLRELAGGVVWLKLVASAVMAWQPTWAVALFWPLVFVSALVSHAPKRWRHWPAPDQRPD